MYAVILLIYNLELLIQLILANKARCFTASIIILDDFLFGSANELVNTLVT